MSDETLGRRFKHWFWRPPRPHGDTIVGRTVSFLELFYDLVYVAVIAQAAHHLTAHVSARGVAEFAVAFALVWTAWVNGSLYLELHGRETADPHIVFIEMGVLVLLAVFTADAASDSGRGFAHRYALFLAISTWLWTRFDVRIAGTTRVRRHRRAIRDRDGRRRRRDVRQRLPPGRATAVRVGGRGRRLDRGHGAGRAIGGRALPRHASHGVAGRAVRAVTIIVLGEFVFGVVAGLAAPKRDAITITTGMIALTIRFGLWWVYFDLVGRRLPRSDGRALAGWLLSHLPITMAITAAGASMVDLIGNAHDSRTPPSTAWLLSGAVAPALLALILTDRALVDAERLTLVYRPLNVALAGGAVAALLVGWMRPAPWLLAFPARGDLSVVWIFAVSRFLRAGAWGEHDGQT